MVNTLRPPAKSYHNELMKKTESCPMYRHNDIPDTLCTSPKVSPLHNGQPEH